MTTIQLLFLILIFVVVVAGCLGVAALMRPDAARRRLSELGAHGAPQLIEQFDAGPVHLVAWSRGGGVALGAVKRRPDLIRKLVLMEPVIACLAPQSGEAGKPDPAVEKRRARIRVLERWLSVVQTR